MSSSEPLPLRQRWATAAARSMGEIASIPTPLLRRGQPFVMVGGKLAAALMPPVMNAGFEPIALDSKHPLFADIPPETPEYQVYGNGFGEIHSARAFRQLVGRAARTFTPREDRWHEDGRVVDAFRPGLRYAATSDREFDVLAERHLNTVRSAFRRAQIVLVALSTSEIWEAVADGAVYPHWATEDSQRFDPSRHRVRMLTVEETIADLQAAVAALRELNPGVEVVLMVSPEPQPATALPVHVLAAGTLGKATLRIAAETAARLDGVHYFPAYEIATLAVPAASYSADGSAPQAAVAAVADALVQISEGGQVSYDEAAAGRAASSEPPQTEAAVQRVPPVRRAKPRRSTGVQAKAFDPLADVAAAEKAKKDAVRAAKRAARDAIEPLGNHAKRIADRDARLKAKAEAKAEERSAKATALKERAPASARAQKLAERKARSETIAAARDAKRAGRAKSDQKVGDTETTAPERRRKPAPTSAAKAETTSTPAQSKARRARREKPATDPSVPAAAVANTTKSDADAAPARRERRGRKPKS